ncbi:hypothetical protein AB0N05_05705 [Nocardia sp. NPDC051030]|uniref:hypothetical protein n=1 Tax=Nocardia sp. NPDC051030 TaxID=3155162 RepID=UPI003444F5B0
MTGSPPQCPQCGWPTTQPFQTLSTHRTSEGTVTYTRCVCGAVRMWLTPTAQHLPLR